MTKCERFSTYFSNLLNIKNPLIKRNTAHLLKINNTYLLVVTPLKKFNARYWATDSFLKFLEQENYNPLKNFSIRLF